MNKPAKWNVIKALLIGAACGAAYVVAQDLLEGGSLPVASLIGLAIGGGAGGALLFGVVAAIRNAFVK